MPLLTFLFEAVLISLSGVLAPGPITAVTVEKGNKSPHAGALVAIGHGIVELPLIISIFYGFGYLLKLNYVKEVIAFVGGLFLLFMGISMFRSIKQIDVNSKKSTHLPIIDGILLSLWNPYFLIWWATVGATLIFRSISFGMLGLLFFMLFHWLCDFFWCYFLSILSFRGRQYFGKKFQKIVSTICGAFLLFFGGKFIYDSIKMFFI
ncbi:MAG: LysE family translocator [Actinobacteria bacterium]|nr:LysE family translocator [Actinomycetota bacterium]